LFKNEALMPSDKLKDLRERKSAALLGGGEQRIDDQHKKGSSPPVNVLTY